MKILPSAAIKMIVVYIEIDIPHKCYISLSASGLIITAADG